jgi:CHAD domain-containing protein
VLDTADPERVHKMRVATRRLRAALEVFGAGLPRKRTRAALADVKMLAAALGERRDCDVLIELLGSLRRETQGERAAIDQLLGELRDEQLEANKRLAKALRISRSTVSSVDCESLLGEGTRDRGSRREDRSREAARRIVAVRTDEVYSLAPGALAGADATALHDLRIAAKRLRYVLELVGFCLGDVAGEAETRMRELQTVIGDAHDCDVLLARLEHSQSKGMRRLAARLSRRANDCSASSWCCGRRSRRVGYTNESLPQRTIHRKTAPSAHNGWSA